MSNEKPLDNPDKSEHVRKLESLTSELGLISTPEMLEARVSAVESMAQGEAEAIKRTLSRYQELAEAVVEQHQGEDYIRAQIGLIIDSGLMWRDAGKLDSYGAEVFNALEYAQNMQYQDLAEILESALEEVKQIREESEQGEHTGFSTDEMIESAKAELPPEHHGEIESLSDLSPVEFMEELAAILINYELAYDPSRFFKRVGWIY